MGRRTLEICSEIQRKKSNECGRGWKKKNNKTAQVDSWRENRLIAERVGKAAPLAQLALKCDNRRTILTSAQVSLTLPHNALATHQQHPWHTKTLPEPVFAQTVRQVCNLRD